ncbi:TM0106 family RecB-like putative nuclease [Achromobacter sp. NPDC058515]|uniref:TM0106 family RecB-like putative nuclease n=1 Tax=Achromobacter sp. NPDC058515 TaxID=3346533 RepID=UPI00364EFEEE
MQNRGSSRLYSATDLVNFLECEHVTSLDLLNLHCPLPQADVDESIQLIQQKGYDHEDAYVRHLRDQGLTVVDIAEGNESLDAKVTATLQAMSAGVDVVFQATLLQNNLAGFADFLIKVERPSSLGNYSYEVSDTKLSRKSKAKFLVQMSFYSKLLTEVQGVAPVSMHVILGDRSRKSYRCADYAHYFEALLARFLSRMEEEGKTTYPEPCSYCDLCRWNHLCKQQWLDDDHLSQVANISRGQILKLNGAGINTMAKLAALSPEAGGNKLQAGTLKRLRHQAFLQVEARRTGKRIVELLPQEPGRGLLRMPEPNVGDMFFDMEGDPLEEGGLEYLFGLYFFDDNQWRFKGFWAHSRPEERVAFEEFVDFVVARLKTYAGAHVYHYAKYEETALKKLMTLHATREAEVDNWLRRGVLVDLYQVVREGIMVSEPRYSIKNIEHFYLEAREGDVTSAGASIVWYERWKETGEQSLLDSIQMYNEDDVRSTQELRDWLLTLRPQGMPWTQPNAGANKVSAETSSSQPLTDAEARLVPYRRALVEPLPQDRLAWTAEDFSQELTYQLLDFHRRADKPAYWAMFQRMDMTEDELLEDPECLAGLECDPQSPPTAVKRSTLYTYKYPAQETKLRSGSNITRTDTGESLGELDMDGEARRIRFKVGPSKEPPPARLALGPGGPVSSKVIQEALFRFSDTVIDGTHLYPALESLLRREVPRIAGKDADAPMITGKATIEACTAVVKGMQNSYLFIQGPPGAGKTYTGSHVIVELLAAGKRVGITSNSHRPINHLLEKVAEVAKMRGLRFKGVKKSGKGDETEYPGEGIENIYDNDEVFSCGAQLVAGTAWLFSRPDANQYLDYLFIDEAGQVSLANLIAVGTSAHNLVLLGDQMQLSQPTQGVHPGRSGDSSLEYLLEGSATIEPNRGIFLETTWRMHPDVCTFISEAVYDSRLQPEPKNQNRVLVLRDDAAPILKPAGIVFASVDHEGCSQQSIEEAELISRLYEDLLRQSYTKNDGCIHPMAPENILVVAPYNMQVNLLRTTLPAGARVGTVDKFQGQEAEVILISMTTSSEAELPRFMEFLFSKNRLNVAVSRAKSLAILVANPALMAIKCSTPEQMSLVNTLCWIASVGCSPQRQLSD